MLTRFVRNQLIIFTIASIVGVTVMLFAYMQVPTLLNVGRLTVTLELPAAGGLYRFANVTYRGVQIGKVKSVTLTENGAEAVLSLNTSPKIPADLEANVLSVSAIGEQYVDLRPRTDSGPYLQDGSRITVSNTTIPQQVGPMLDQVSTLVDSIPGDRISDLLDETFKAFNGAGPDFGSLHRLRRDADRATQQCLRRVTRADRRQWAAAGLTGRDRRLHPDVGAQPRRRHRATRAERSPDTRAPGTRTGLRAGGFGASEPDQADAAGAAGEPDHAGADPRHVQPVARATAGRLPQRAVGSAGLRSWARTTPPAWPSAISR